MVKQLVENKGKSVSKAMIEVGYPPTTAKNPQQVTESIGFRELMGKTFTPEYMQMKHDELMNAKVIDNAPFHHKITDTEITEILEGQGLKVIGTKRFMTDARIYFIAPDNAIRDKALDKLYKLFGHYAPEKVKIEDGLPMTDEELDEAIDQHQSTVDRFKQFKKTKSGRRPKGT